MTKICSLCKESKPHAEFGKTQHGDKFGLRSRCKECSNLMRRAHYVDNKKKYQEWYKSWYALNRDSVAERDSKRDKSRRAATNKAYIQAHPDKKRAYDQNRRAKISNADGVITGDVIKLIFDVYGRACLACSSTESIEIDHVVPLSVGGSNLVDNLQPLCKSCNSSKGSRSSADYRPFIFDFAFEEDGVNIYL